MATTAVFRTFGPAFGGAIFAWSISEHRAFPFNQSLAFIFFALVIFASSYICRRLPATLNSPIKDE
jgi:hypothetical protein